MIPFLHLLFELCCKKSTIRPSVPFGKKTTLAWLGLLLLSNTMLHGQFVETFDRPGTYFQLWRHDCKAKVLRPERPEPGVETIEVYFSYGSYLHFIYPIEPSAAVDDLSASLRIRCGHDGLRIGFRIVFPRSAHPATNNPLDCVVFGTSAEGKGQWSISTVRKISNDLEAQRRVLRARYGSDVDLSASYVDAVVLDVYRIPGTTKLQVDDLLVEGMLPPNAEVSSTASTSPSVETRSVEARLQEMQASVPRWIQFHGEGLAHLQSLGFNGVVAPRANDTLLAEQAASTGLAVVAPPPDGIPADSIANDYQHVHAWWLGWELNESQLSNTRQQVSKLARFPKSMAKPTLGEAMEMFGSYSRQTDLLAIPTPHSTRVRSFDESDTILMSDSRSLTGRSMPLTSMVTQMSSEWIEQKAMLQRILGGDPIGIPDYDLVQTRLSVYRAMMQGTRGWIFRSSGPLDRGDPTSMARGQGYAAINNEIDLFSPWIKSNQSSWKTIATDSQDHRAAILTTTNSQLVIMVSNGPMDQICAISPTTERVKIALPMIGQVRNVFRITYGQLERLVPDLRPDATYVTIERPSLIEQIVTVVDPKPIEYLREQFAQRAPIIMESRIDAAQQSLQLAQMATTAQRLSDRHEHWEWIRQSQSLYRDAMHQMSRSDVTRALISADRSLMLSQRVLRRSWEEAITQFSSFQSSPFVASPLALPLHWDLHHRLTGRQWQRLTVPGTAVNNWGQMQEAGWFVDQRLQSLITTFVDVQSNGTNSDPVLVLASAPATQQPIPSGYAGAAMRVTSAPIIAPVGSLVHVKGEVNIESSPSETQSGLLISDSLGGEALGQLISSADPSKETWRPFGLSRVVTDPNGFQLFFETRGQMVARIREIQAETIIPASPPGLPVRQLEIGEVVR